MKTRVILAAAAAMAPGLAFARGVHGGGGIGALIVFAVCAFLVWWAWTAGKVWRDEHPVAAKRIWWAILIAIWLLVLFGIFMLKISRRH